ncbi:Aminoacyl-tRNA synthetase, class II (D/K/N) [Dillenia turbinata]|uniref:asparagine--tRNA ligase n=1 Tax=Dillenia turbinata TaxID=194707 RepID=A0AAN8ZNK4_9MAGN
MASKEAKLAMSVTLFKYSNRVILKTILCREDRGLGLIGERVVIGGWVKSSKEIRKEPTSSPPRATLPLVGQKEVSCVEILQTKVPFFRSIIKAFSGGNQPPRDKLDSAVSKPTPLPLPPPPPTSTIFLQVSDGSCTASLQVVVDSSVASLGHLTQTGTCVLVEGELKQSKEQGKHAIELKAEKILHIGMVEQDKYPLSKKKILLPSLRDFPHFRPRTTTVASFTRIRDALTYGTHTFFQQNGFIHVHIPIITTTDCEGSGEKFHVTSLQGKASKKEEPKAADEVNLAVVKAAIKEKTKLIEELNRTESNREALYAAMQDLKKTNELVSQLESKERELSKDPLKAVSFKEDFFARQTYLTASGRLHLESYACALGNVYSFGPRFRAEKVETSKSMAEMWMVEVEMAFSQLEGAMNCADDLLKHLCKWVLENCSDDMKFISKRVDRAIVDRLVSMTSTSFEKVSYAEAVDILKKATDKIFEAKTEGAVALNEEHLSYLADEVFKRPIVVHSYPKELKPFYVRVNDDGKTVAAFDMVVPKVGTLIRGSQNEERINVLSTRITEMGLEREQYEWYLDLRRHGTVRHSGFSLAFDLMVLFVTGILDVKETIPFPRSYGKANC